MSDNQVNLPGFRELWPQYVPTSGQQSLPAPSHLTNGNSLPAAPRQYYLPPSSHSMSPQPSYPPPPPSAYSAASQPPAPHARGSGTLNPAVWDEEPDVSQSVPEHRRRYACQLCGKRFVRPSSLETHMNSHTGDKPYSCTYPGCSKAFSVKSNMQRHLKIHQ